MARRKKGNKVDGWLVIDKPLGMTSAQVVGKARYLTKAQKAGHAGTLDPLASGVLPIGFGEGTKTMPFIVDSTKVYMFRVQWGTATDSDDMEGTIIAQGGSIPEKPAIDAVLPHFCGTITQVPPAYSAVKVNGKRAYDLARAGQDVTLAQRHVEIQSLTHDRYNGDAGFSDFTVTCGKGTYVRSLARDMAVKLGTYGHVTVLRRLRVGPFEEKHTISLEKLAELSHSAPAESYVLPVMTALDDIPALAITEDEAARIRCGMPLHHSFAKPGTVVLVCDETPIAIGESTENTIKPVRVFNM